MFRFRKIKKEQDQPMGEEYYLWDIGTLVQLKSGSPIMTITAYNGLKQAVCTWYCEQTKDFKQLRVFAASLEEIKK